jgi:hypothetical protein
MPILPFDPNDLYYVIIGCGFSAITNHSILQQTGQRLGSLKVLHIGSPDPWADYHSMPMGQWPSLLTLPGFQNQPSNLTGTAGLGSDEFATINQSEWNRISSVRPFCHLNSRVVSIRSVSTSPNEYEIELDDPGRTIVRAAYIDVCGGPGPAKDLPTGVIISPVLRNEYETGSSLPGLWPRLLSGENYLSKSFGTPLTNKAICVIGGGPTSAWCVERAQSQGNSVLWLSLEELNSAFVSSRRNDALVGGIVRRRFEQGEHVVIGFLRPRKSTTIFAEAFQATAVRTLPHDRVRVEFQPIPGKKNRYVNSQGWQTSPGQEDFDQVIYSIGQNTETFHPKSWPYILSSVLAGAIYLKTHLIRDRNRRVVGLQSADRCIRVLGAAAFSHPLLNSEWTTSGNHLNVFFRSLPEQARVRIGITLCALTISEANGYWSGAANENLNTAGLLDLKTMMTLWDTELNGPETWFEMRGCRIPPFAHSEFAGLMNRKMQY